MKEIFRILFEYQQESIKLKKDADNPFFKSKYVTLDNILDHYIPRLNNDGILCLHNVVNKELVTSLVLVESGETITSSFPLNNTDPQKQGSEISYGKRYNLGCLLNIQTDTDDDGNIASSEGNTRQFYQTQQTQPTQDLGTCTHCGADNKLSKAGKIYCGAMCWKN